MDRDQVSGIGRAKSHMCFFVSAVCENRHEQAFTGEEPFTRPHQFSHKAAFTICTRCITKYGVHFNIIILVHHGAGFSHRAFSGIKFNFHELHFSAQDFKIDFIGTTRGKRRR